MQQGTNRSQLLRLPEVLKILPIGRTMFYEGIELGTFPKPVKLGKRTVAWRESEVRAAIKRLNAPRSPAQQQPPVDKDRQD